jgi:hypothetical protein
MNNKTHGKDIMLLCKGWYDKEKYKTLKDALIEYYHKNYGCEDITPDYGFINQVLLKPAIEEFAETNSKLLIHYLLDDDILLKTKETDGTYDNELYNRLTIFLNMLIVKDHIDTSEYFYNEEDRKW